MGIVVACVNLKGGVGKTALAVNFAAYAGKTGLKTLLIDLDPQTNATFSCVSPDAWQKHSEAHGTVADLLGARKFSSATGKAKSPGQVVIEDVFANVDLIPSHLDLFTIDLDLAGAIARETRLKRVLEGFDETYDIVVCDCPPNLTIPTQNALAFSEFFVVPVSPDYLSAIGVGLLKNRVADFSADIGHTTKLAGIVFSRMGRPAHHRDEVAATLRAQFKGDVFPQELRERVQVSEMASKQKPIYDGTDKEAISEFTDVSLELLRRIGL